MDIAVKTVMSIIVQRLPLRFPPKHPRQTPPVRVQSLTGARFLRWPPRFRQKILDNPHAREQTVFRCAGWSFFALLKGAIQMLLFDLEREVTPLSRNEKFELIRYLLDLIAADEQSSRPPAPVSFLRAAQTFAGCIAETPADLSTNATYLEGYGA